MRIDLKKNKHITCLKISFTILFLFNNLVVESDEIPEIHVSLENSLISISALPSDTLKQMILSCLDDGLKSQIYYQIRAYQKNQGFFSFLGDIIIFETNPSYLAYFDFFETKYTIQTNTMDIIKIDNSDDFLDTFFSLLNYRLKELDELHTGIYYVNIRIHLEPVRLVPPFNLLSLFKADESFTSDWIQFDL